MAVGAVEAVLGVVAVVGEVLEEEELLELGQKLLQVFEITSLGLYDIISNFIGQFYCCLFLL